MSLIKSVTHCFVFMAFKIIVPISDFLSSWDVGGWAAQRKVYMEVIVQDSRRISRSQVQDYRDYRTWIQDSTEREGSSVLLKDS